VTGRRALLVGAGYMGRIWGGTLAVHPDVRLAGWVDVRPGVAEEAAAGLACGPLHTGTDLDAAIAAVRPDFVVDVTSPEAHHEVTLRALDAGLPVLGEKPIAHRLDHAREMVAAAERAGRLYMVSQNRRYNPGLFAFRQVLLERASPPELLDCGFYRAPRLGGYREEMAHPVLMDMAIHHFDMARFLTGADPVAVWCEEHNPGWSWYRGPAYAAAVFEMTGGVRFAYRGAYCSDGRPTSWNGDWRAAGAGWTATWDGGADRAGVLAEATVELGTSADQANRAFDPQETAFEPEVARVPVPEVPVLPSITGSLAEFLDALETGRTPMCECHDNLKSLAMVLAAVESAATGRRVPVET
jgi:predicted dehydrogenase